MKDSQEIFREAEAHHVEHLEAVNSKLLAALEEIRDTATGPRDSPRTSLTPVGALLAIEEKARATIEEAKK